MRALPWLPVAVAATLQWLVLATAPFLPFVDLPQHVAQAQLLLHLREPAIAHLYDARLFPQVNVLALFTLAPALAVLQEPAAVWIVLALYVGGLAFALYRLTRVLGTPAWGAAAALLFAIQFNLWYGFLSFCLGLPILIFLVARWAGQEAGDHTSRRALAVDAILWWLLPLAHTLLFAFALAAFALWVLWGTGRTVRLRRAIAIVPALAWCIAWLVTTRAVLGASSQPGGLEALWESPRTKILELGRALLVASRPGLTEWCVLAAVVVAVMWAIAAAVRRRRTPAHDSNSTSMRSWVFAVGALGLIAYVLLPYSIYERDRVTYGLFILYPRFAVLAPLFVLPALRGPASRRRRVGVAIAIAAAHLALAAQRREVLMRVGREAAPLDQAFAVLATGRILKSLVFTPYPQDLRYEAFLHVGSYYQARRLGETDQSFAALLPSPVHYRDPRQHAYLSLQDEHLRPESFDANRASEYDYVLLYNRGNPASLGALPVFVRGAWRIEAPP